MVSWVNPHLLQCFESDSGCHGNDDMFPSDIPGDSSQHLWDEVRFDGQEDQPRAIDDLSIRVSDRSASLLSEHSQS